MSKREAVDKVSTVEIDVKKELLLKIVLIISPPVDVAMSDCVKGVEESVNLVISVRVESLPKREGERGVFVWSVDGEGGGVAVKGTSCDEEHEGGGRSANMQLKPCLKFAGEDDSTGGVLGKELELAGEESIGVDKSTK